MSSVVLGIDPGIARTGFGVIEADERGFKHLRHDIIFTESGLPTGSRLLYIYEAIIDVVRAFSPVLVGIESLYFAKNISSAFPVAHARGVILLAMAQEGIPAMEFPPQEIKMAITGNGRANKAQVQELVRFLLGLSEQPEPDHAADALAAAICCYNSSRGVAGLEPTKAR